MFQAAAEPHRLQHLFGAALGFFPGNPAVFQDLLDLLRGMQRREQVEALEDKTAVIETEPVDLAAALLPQVFTQRRNRAFVRLHQATQCGDQGRLTRARRPHDHGNLAMVGVEIDALEHLLFHLADLVALGQGLGIEG